MTIETAAQARQAKLKSNLTFTGTLSQETLTGGYGYKIPSTKRSRQQEDFDWPCGNAYGNVFVRGGGLEHTEGHGHRLACEYMKGYRGGGSKFCIWRAAAVSGMIMGRRERLMSKILARGDDLADRIDNLRICTGLKKERQIFLLCCACAIREVDAVLQENLPSSKSAPSGLLFLSKSYCAKIHS